MEKRYSLKFKYISFDDTLLQSSKLFQTNLKQVLKNNNDTPCNIDDYTNSLEPSFLKTSNSDTNKKKYFLNIFYGINAFLSAF